MRFNTTLIQDRLPERIHRARIVLVVLVGLAAICLWRNARVIGVTAAAQDRNDSTASTRTIFQQYCLVCHGAESPQAGMNLERLTAQGVTGDNFRLWQKVVTALEQKLMPPKVMPQPSTEERHQALSWIKAEMSAYGDRHDDDPGPVTVRRLTSGEYAYTIKDLTGLDVNAGIDSSTDSVGGEGFTNFGDVQFMQDANLERYLEAAKIIADHAVIGSGPLGFFPDRGKTGFELSAITRIKDIYAANGFRTVSGEGGRPFGLEKYGKALYVAWRYRHRAALDEQHVTLTDLANREGISRRFAGHIWQVVNNPSLGFPCSEVASRWRKLAPPAADRKAAVEAARAACEEIQKFIVSWPSWLFARGDLA